MKETTHRSDCPISYSLDIIGDKWSLLILRDMIFAGKTSYTDFLKSDEGIATNILANRLTALESAGIIAREVASTQKAKYTYTLTDKGIALIPVVMELAVWGSHFSPAGGNEQLLRQLKKDRKGTIKQFTRKLKKGSEA